MFHSQAFLRCRLQFVFHPKKSDFCSRQMYDLYSPSWLHLLEWCTVNDGDRGQQGRHKPKACLRFFIQQGLSKEQDREIPTVAQEARGWEKRRERRQSNACKSMSYSVLFFRCAFCLGPAGSKYMDQHPEIPWRQTWKVSTCLDWYRYVMLSQKVKFSFAVIILWITGFLRGEKSSLYVAAGSLLLWIFVGL